MSKRKAYRPKGVETNPLLAVQRHSREPLAQAKVRELLIAAHASLTALEMGYAKEEDLHLLALVSNVSLLLCEQGLAEDHFMEIRDAQIHIVEAMKRFAATQRLGFAGQGLVALRRLLEVVDAQMTWPGLTQGALTTALSNVLQRLAQGHSYDVK